MSTFPEPKHLLTTGRPRVAHHDPDRPDPVHAKPRLRWVHNLEEAVGGPKVVRAAIGGTLITLVWLTVFTVGLSVPTQAYRDRLLLLGTDKAASYSTADIFSDLFVVGVSFTPTNLAMLCCVAALAGCLGRLATTNGGVGTKKPNPTGANKDAEPSAAPAGSSPAAASTDLSQQVSPLAPAISAITWGFFIYLVAISGTLVITGEPFKNTSPEQYLRMAGSASLIAFIVGWRPEFMAQLVGQIGTGKLIK